MAKKPSQGRPWRRRLVWLVVWGVGGLCACFVIILLWPLPSDEKLDATRMAEASTEVALARAESIANTETEAVYIAGTETAVASITPTITLTPSDTPVPSDTPLPADGTTLYIASNSNTWECPETSCDIVRTLPAGTQVTGIEQVKGRFVLGSDQWWKADYQGQELYIHSTQVSRTRPIIQQQSSDGNIFGGGNTSSPIIRIAPVYQPQQQQSGNTGAPAPPRQQRPGNCPTAVAMGLTARQAAQWSHLDRDNDGVACYGD